MAASLLNHALRRILRALGPGGGDDFDLLDRFAEHGEEEAFEILLARHGPMVWRTCQRIVRQAADAEDAFQATFLVLCRKAGAIRRRESLAGWLHQVAYRIALKVNARSIARPLDASQLAAAGVDPTAGVVQADLRQFLDASLGRLPDKYRVPLILCYLEGKTLRRAAAELGWPEGTLATRLARGKELLRAELLARQVTLSAAGLAAFLTQESLARTVPGALVEATAKAKSLFLLGEAAAAGSHAVLLAEGALQAMSLTKIKTAAIMVLLGLLAVGSGVVMNAAVAGRQAPRPADEPAQADPGKPVAQNVHVDVYGDPLPTGALARMGTVRLRHIHFSPFSIAWTRNGKLLATGSIYDVRLWDPATGQLLREIRDGKPEMYCILEFSPDGRRLAGAGMHATWIWDVATGQRLQEFPANGQSLAWSPDGKLLAVRSKAGPVFVWEAATGRQVAELSDKWSNEFRSMRFTTDGKSVVTASGARLIRWDVAEQKRHVTDLPPGYSWFIASPDGESAAVFPSDRGQPLALWDLSSDKEPRKLQGELAHKSSVLAFSHDGKTLAMNTTTNMENPDAITIGLWDAKTGELRRRYQLPTHYVTSLHFSPDDRTLVTTGHFHPAFRLWDAETGKEVLTWPAHVDAVMSVAFTPDGRSLVSGSLDCTVRLWDVASGRQVRELAGHRWRCDVVAVAPDGKILSGGGDGCILVRDRDGTLLRRLLIDGPPEQQARRMTQVLALGVTLHSRTVASYSSDINRSLAHYHLWDLATGTELSSRPDMSRVRGARLNFSADTRLVLESLYEDLVGVDGPTLTGALLRATATGKEILWLRDPAASGQSSLHALAPDGRTVLTVTLRQEKTGKTWRHENLFHLWEAATGKARLTISRGPAKYWIKQIAYAPNGRVLAAASGDGTIEFWDLTTGKELPGRITPAGPARDEVRDAVECLAFSPDGRLLAAGRRDGAILIWPTPTAAQPAGNTDAWQRNNP